VRDLYLGLGGETFGEAITVLSVKEYWGAKQIRLLLSYSLTYHGQSVEVKAQPIECGRKFVSLLGVHHRVHKGRAFYTGKEWKIVMMSVDKSRIMIDVAFFRKNLNYWRAKLAPLSDADMFDFASLVIAVYEEDDDDD